MLEGRAIQFRDGKRLSGMRRLYKFGGTEKAEAQKKTGTEAENVKEIHFWMRVFGMVKNQRDTYGAGVCQTKQNIWCLPCLSLASILLFLFYHCGFGGAAERSDTHKTTYKRIYISRPRFQKRNVLKLTKEIYCADWDFKLNTFCVLSYPQNQYIHDLIVTSPLLPMFHAPPRKMGWLSCVHRAHTSGEELNNFYYWNIHYNNGSQRKHFNLNSFSLLVLKLDFQLAKRVN